MTTRIGQVLAVAAAALGLTACGGSSGGGGSGNGGGTVGGGAPGFYITIQGMAFSPAQLSVPPGATVTVVNMDAFQHSVTSEATAGAFTPGSVGGVQFDTSPFTGTRTFTVPANAVEGSVVPYYCTVHKQAMVTPTATIKIDNSAQPGPAPGSTGSGGGGGGSMGGGY